MMWPIFPPNHPFISILYRLPHYSFPSSLMKQKFRQLFRNLAGSITDWSEKDWRMDDVEWTPAWHDDRPAALTDDRRRTKSRLVRFGSWDCASDDRSLQFIGSRAPHIPYPGVTDLTNATTTVRGDFLSSVGAQIYRGQMEGSAEEWDHLFIFAFGQPFSFRV